MPKISIIVPVYKVEKYLDRCVNSLIAQTLSDIEIILVDDGSPDRCPGMCDEWAEKDKRIRVVHKENGGLSSARNAGMAVAHGAFMGFVDSDDTVLPEMYEKMLAVMEAERVDFVMSDYIRVPAEDRPYLKTLGVRGGLYSKEDIRSEIFPSLIMGENLDYGPLLSVWHCLYRTEFLRENQIRFDEDVRWSEDNIFSAMVGYCAESFYYMKGEGLYCYYQNPGSITTAYRAGAWDVYKTMNKHLRVFFRERKEFNFSNQFNLHLIYYACNCLNQCALLKAKECREQIKCILNDKELKMALKSMRIDNVDIKLRLQLLLMKYRLSLVVAFLVSRRR